MVKQLESLGELELTALRVIWDHPNSSVQEVTALLQKNRDCARTTVLTVIQRLHAKGFLRRRKNKGVFRYTSSQEPDKVLHTLVERFVNSMLAGSPLPFLSYLANAEKLTDEQTQEIHRIIKSLDE